MKKNVSNIKKIAHTPNTKVGGGDFYGQAIKNKESKLINSYMSPTQKVKAKTPPRGLA